MTVDIVNKITKTYDHNNKLVKMVDEECSGLSYITESYFYHYVLYTMIYETITRIEYNGNKSSKSIVNHKIRLNPYGWILLIFTLASLSLLLW